jgi:hypothetical protein
VITVVGGKRYDVKHVALQPFHDTQQLLPSTIGPGLGGTDDDVSRPISHAYAHVHTRKKSTGSATDGSSHCDGTPCTDELLCLFQDGQRVVLDAERVRTENMVVGVQFELNTDAKAAEEARAVAEEKRSPKKKLANLFKNTFTSRLKAENIMQEGAMAWFNPKGHNDLVPARKNNLLEGMRANAAHKNKLADARAKQKAVEQERKQKAERDLLLPYLSVSIRTGKAGNKIAAAAAEEQISQYGSAGEGTKKKKQKYKKQKYKSLQQQLHKQAWRGAMSGVQDERDSIGRPASASGKATLGRGFSTVGGSPLRPHLLSTAGQQKRTRKGAPQMHAFGHSYSPGDALIGSTAGGTLGVKLGQDLAQVQAEALVQAKALATAGMMGYARRLVTESFERCFVRTPPSHLDAKTEEEKAKALEELDAALVVEHDQYGNPIVPTEQPSAPVRSASEMGMRVLQGSQYAADNASVHEVCEALHTIVLAATSSGTGAAGVAGTAGAAAAGPMCWPAYTHTFGAKGGFRGGESWADPSHGSLGVGAKFSWGITEVFGGEAASKFDSHSSNAVGVASTHCRLVDVVLTVASLLESSAALKSVGSTRLQDIGRRVISTLRTKRAIPSAIPSATSSRSAPGVSGGDASCASGIDLLAAMSLCAKYGARDAGKRQQQWGRWNTLENKQMPKALNTRKRRLSGQEQALLRAQSPNQDEQQVQHQDRGSLGTGLESWSARMKEVNTVQQLVGDKEAADAAASVGTVEGGMPSILEGGTVYDEGESSPSSGLLSLQEELEQQRRADQSSLMAAVQDVYRQIDAQGFNEFSTPPLAAYPDGQDDEEQDRELMDTLLQQQDLSSVIRLVTSELAVHARLFPKYVRWAGKTLGIMAEMGDPDELGPTGQNGDEALVGVRLIPRSLSRRCCLRTGCTAEGGVLNPIPNPRFSHPLEAHMGTEAGSSGNVGIPGEIHGGGIYPNRYHHPSLHENSSSYAARGSWDDHAEGAPGFAEEAHSSSYGQSLSQGCTHQHEIEDSPPPLAAVFVHLTLLRTPPAAIVAAVSAVTAAVGAWRDAHRSAAKAKAWVSKVDGTDAREQQRSAAELRLEEEERKIWMDTKREEGAKAEKSFQDMQRKKQKEAADSIAAAKQEREILQKRDDRDGEAQLQRIQKVRSFQRSIEERDQAVIKQSMLAAVALDHEEEQPVVQPVEQLGEQPHSAPKRAIGATTAGAANGVTTGVGAEREVAKSSRTGAESWDKQMSEMPEKLRKASATIRTAPAMLAFAEKRDEDDPRERGRKRREQEAEALTAAAHEAERVWVEREEAVTDPLCFQSTDFISRRTALVYSLGAASGSKAYSKAGSRSQTSVVEGIPASERLSPHSVSFLAFERLRSVSELELRAWAAFGAEQQQQHQLAQQTVQHHWGHHHHRRQRYGHKSKRAQSAPERSSAPSQRSIWRQTDQSQPVRQSASAWAAAATVDAAAVTSGVFSESHVHLLTARRRQLASEARGLDVMGKFQTMVQQLRSWDAEVSEFGPVGSNNGSARSRHQKQQQPGEAWSSSSNSQPIPCPLAQHGNNSGLPPSGFGDNTLQSGFLLTRKNSHRRRQKEMFSDLVINDSRHTAGHRQWRRRQQQQQQQPQQR